jgi:hypothetical protein
VEARPEPPRVYSKDDGIAEHFAIDDFSFDWVIMKSGDTRLGITKTQDTTSVHLDSRVGHVSMEPMDAENLGTLLKRTDDEYNVLKESKSDKSNEVIVGKIKVTFRWYAKDGFRVWIAMNAPNAKPVILERKDANDASAHLAKATKMAAYLDSKTKL